MPDQPVFVQSNEVILPAATDYAGGPVRIWFKSDNGNIWVWKGTLLGQPELDTSGTPKSSHGPSYRIPARRYRCRRKGYIWLNGAVAIKYGWSD